MVDRSKSLSETLRPAPSRGPASAKKPKAGDDPILDLQRQAGNRAVAEVIEGQSGGVAADASPALRLRDALRAGRAVPQRELSLTVQRDAKEGEAKSGASEAKIERLLRFGSRGPDVAEVQTLLGLVADGRFGRRTRTAVVDFQRSVGLVPDGIVGPLTRGALRGRAREEEKLAGEEKLPSGEAKLPTSEEKLPSSEAKLPGEDKLPNSEEKLAGEQKLPSSTDKLLDEEKLP
jgi:murein L,D-transpeptidase YcbB/YkuD